MTPTHDDRLQESLHAINNQVTIVLALAELHRVAPGNSGDSGDWETVGQAAQRCRALSQAFANLCLSAGAK